MTTLHALATTDFPADHLPYGVAFVDTDRHRAHHLVTRVGDHVIDLAHLVEAGQLDIDLHLVTQPSLNALMDAGPATWDSMRGQLLDLDDADVSGAVHHIEAVELVLPIEVSDYVDSYASIEHATNLGRLFRPDSEPLLPNWRHIPIAYHGRAGTVVVSDTLVHRPLGQRLPAGESSPIWGPSTRLDIELELGAVLAAPGGARYDDAEHHLFGVVLVNDWSARDIQAWEYQPLGPYLGKSFATSISAWVVPVPALEAYRVELPEQTPQPLPYLTAHRGSNLDIALEVEWSPNDGTNDPRTGEIVSRTNSSGLYWSFAQQIEHMRSNGAPIRTGDLIATGTISGPTPGSEGSFIELTRNGTNPRSFADGTVRSFLEDGDTVTLRGRLGSHDGPCLGEVVGTIDPAPSR